jgi:hypothetical protein
LVFFLSHDWYLNFCKFLSTEVQVNLSVTADSIPDTAQLDQLRADFALLVGFDPSRITIRIILTDDSGSKRRSTKAIYSYLMQVTFTDTTGNGVGTSTPTAALVDPTLTTVGAASVFQQASSAMISSSLSSVMGGEAKASGPTVVPPATTKTPPAPAFVVVPPPPTAPAPIATEIPSTSPPLTEDPQAPSELETIPPVSESAPTETGNQAPSGGVVGGNADPGGFEGGAVAGIAIGAAVGGMLIGGLVTVVLLYIRRKRSKNTK